MSGRAAPAAWGLMTALSVSGIAVVVFRMIQLRGAGDFFVGFGWVALGFLIASTITSFRMLRLSLDTRREEQR